MTSIHGLHRDKQGLWVQSFVDTAHWLHADAIDWSKSLSWESDLATLLAAAALPHPFHPLLFFPHSQALIAAQEDAGAASWVRGAGSDEEVKAMHEHFTTRLATLKDWNTPQGRVRLQRDMAVLTQPRAAAGAELA
jgi:hypothetical protein